MAKRIRSLTDLEVYQRAVDVSMQLFECSKKFPKEEMYSLTDQMRKSSRSVCSNMVEAWRKRRYPASFVSKLTDADAEAAETQSWIEFAVRCGYPSRSEGADFYKSYDRILRTLVGMITHPNSWVLPYRSAKSQN